MSLTFGTFCSGIGAPEMAWTRLGWRPLFASEINPFASAVLAHHYPHTPNLGDMIRLHALLKYGGRKVRRGRVTDQLRFQYLNAMGRVGSVDVMAAGTPCQDFSIAGRREGFKGARGSLTFVFLDLVKIGRPDWVVFENVPGILSGDCATGFATFLDELERMGYVVDVDILDAQFFGTPQRRRRVFVCGQHVESLLNTKTISSALTIAQCMTESLLLAFAVLSGRSLTGCEGLGFDVSDAARSLRKRMRLFGMEKAGAAQRLRASLDALPPSSGCEPAASASRRGRRSAAASRSTGGTSSSGSTGATGGRAAASPSTAQSWSDTWDEAFSILNGCITSTPASGTTASKIYTCARLTLTIAGRIIPSPPSSPAYWSAASSALIAIAEFMSYARSTTQSLFADLERFQPWSDFIGEAERLFQAVGCPGAWRSPKSLLSFLDGVQGHPPPGRQAGAGVAGPLARGSDISGGYRNDADTAENLIAHTLRGDGSDAGEDGTGRGTPLVSVTASTVRSHPNRIDSDCADTLIPLAYGGNNTRGPINVATALNAHPSASGRINFKSETFVVGTLNHNGKAAGSATQQDAESGLLIPVSFDWQAGGSHPVRPPTMDVVGALAAEPGMKQQTYVLPATAMAVRRLTPRECERLQGFPDDFTAVPFRGKPASDGPRYKVLGNSMAVPVLAWIGKRIEQVDAVMAAAGSGAA